MFGCRLWQIRLKVGCRSYVEQMKRQTAGVSRTSNTSNPNVPLVEKWCKIFVSKEKVRFQKEIHINLRFIFYSSICLWCNWSRMAQVSQLKYISTQKILPVFRLQFHFEFWYDCVSWASLIFSFLYLFRSYFAEGVMSYSRNDAFTVYYRVNQGVEQFDGIYLSSIHGAELWKMFLQSYSLQLFLHRSLRMPRHLFVFFGVFLLPEILSSLFSRLYVGLSLWWWDGRESLRFRWYLE